MTRYEEARNLFTMSEYGEEIFPRHKGKLFILKFHPLTGAYVKARRVDQRSWTIYHADFFRRAKRKV